MALHPWGSEKGAIKIVALFQFRWVGLIPPFLKYSIFACPQVACPYRAKGCEYVNKLETLASHKKSCTFNPSNLPQFLKDEDENKSRLGDIASMVW